MLSLIALWILYGVVCAFVVCAVLCFSVCIDCYVWVCSFFFSFFLCILAYPMCCHIMLFFLSTDIPPTTSSLSPLPSYFFLTVTFLPSLSLYLSPFHLSSASFTNFSFASFPTTLMILSRFPALTPYQSLHSRHSFTTGFSPFASSSYLPPV